MSVSPLFGDSSSSKDNGNAAPAPQSGGIPAPQQWAPAPIAPPMPMQPPMAAPAFQAAADAPIAPYVAPQPMQLPPMPSQFNDQWIATLGQREMTQVAGVSKSLLEQTKASELEQFGMKLGELISTAKGLRPQDLKDKGLIGKIKGMFGSAKEQFMSQYQTVAKQIDRFMAELQAHSTLQQRRITDLERMYEANYQEHQSIERSIAEGTQVAETMRHQLSGIDTSGMDTMAAQRIQDLRATLDRLEKRVDDLKRVKMLAEQTAPQIRLMQENARLLVNKFNDIKTLTIPAWQKQFALQIVLMEQKRGADLANAVDDATNEALKRSADLLRQNTQQIGRAAQRGVVDIETLEHINRQTIGALEDARQIVEEGRRQRAQTDVQLESMRSQLLTVMNRQGPAM